MRPGHSRGRFLSASLAPGRTPPGPQATRASDTDPGKQGAARPGTQRGEGSGAARAPRPFGRSGEEMGVIGHVRRAVGAGPPRCGKSLPAPPWPSSFLGSAGLRGTRVRDSGWAGTQALPFLLAEFLLEAPVREALLTMPEGVDWLSGMGGRQRRLPLSAQRAWAHSPAPASWRCLGSFEPQASALILV